MVEFIVEFGFYNLDTSPTSYDTPNQEGYKSFTLLTIIIDHPVLS